MASTVQQTWQPTRDDLQVSLAELRHRAPRMPASLDEALASPTWHKLIRCHASARLREASARPRTAAVPLRPLPSFDARRAAAGDL
ncbi:hypothetical protein [Rubrivivax gelatinosus]|uniref:Uncharacterized protein n=1 Tax=Rubrivivax gelatinosus TaxID=28068 RepID=A0ABS1DNW6_RUBGE|nr:hypothetical protein [Rubrivivax gelatinosus]MBK1711265.1 hypothetical protein [Rubrivivax gelatinosus]